MAVVLAQIEIMDWDNTGTYVSPLKMRETLLCLAHRNETQKTPYIVKQSLQLADSKTSIKVSFLVKEREKEIWKLKLDCD